jgi:hypothetical protein
MWTQVIVDDDLLGSESLELEVDGVVTGALVRPGGKPGRLELHRGEVDRRQPARKLLS